MNRTVSPAPKSPASREYRQIRITIFLLVAVVLVATIGITAINIREGNIAVTDVQQRSSRNLVRSVEAHSALIVGEAQQILEGIGYFFLERRKLVEFEQSVFHEVLQAAVARSNYLEALYLLDTDAHAIASGNTFPLPEWALTISFMRSMSISPGEKSFHLGSITRSDTESGPVIGGRWLLPAVSPIIDERNEIAGYVIGVIDPQVFRTFYETMEVGEHGLVLMWDSNGTLVAGNQNSPWETGYQSDEMAMRMGQYESETAPYSVFTYAGMDNGVPFVASQLGAQSLSLGLSVTLDGRDYLEQWSADRRRMVIGALIFVAVIAFLTLILLKYVKQKEIDEMQIRQSKDEADLAMNVAIQANDTKNQFLAQVSHEFRTPLNAILGFSETMSAGALGIPLDKKYQEYVDGIHQSGQHLLAVVNDLIDLARVEAGEYRLHRNSHSILDCVDHALEMLSNSIEVKAIKVSVTRTNQDILVYSDKKLTDQVLINILSNAVKFSPSNSEINISTKVGAHGNIDLTITDYAGGIDKRILDQVGAPFIVERAQTNRDGQGAGLGLSITKRFMELMEGEMEISSVLGTGTTVTLRFPCA